MAVESRSCGSCRAMCQLNAQRWGISERELDFKRPSSLALRSHWQMFTSPFARLLWDSMDFPMSVSHEMKRCEDVPSRAPGAGEHNSVEQCVHERKIATLEGTIEQQKHHIVKLQESLAEERNGHEQKVQELLTENKQHKLRICHLEGRLAEGVKQTSEKTNVSFTVQLTSDVERLRFYTGFSFVE
ncbi:hypothetical protein HPB47_023791 [Ixodes persulcatus]|uniref:Uncharacterized protein n=1 Tax=Ixodes persulcatus TaxID=34615 RepID=A0AC60Q613_IXOPE|nr:hypothetical protein HPB47_023791 [Ixodes persulcatus]